MHTLSLEACSGGWLLEVVFFFSRRLRKRPRWTPLMSCRVAILCHSCSMRVQRVCGQAGVG
jgi:hypothetical protein